MRIIDADKLHPDCLSKDGRLAISQSQIANAPTVVPERPRGEWIKVKEEIMSVDTVTLYKCSECERVIATLPSKLAKYYPFCHCGADMRKGGAE